MKYLIIYTFLLLNFSMLNAQNLFQKSIATVEWDAGYDLIQTENNDIVVTGYTMGVGAGYRDIYLIRLNDFGDTLWTKTYGGMYDGDFGYSVIETWNNDLMITGTTSSFGAGGFDIFVIKTDYMGDTIWTRTYGTAENEHAYSIKETRDSCYVIAGYIKNSITDYNIFIIKIDSDGNLIFSKQYGESSKDYGFDMTLTGDNGIIVTGSMTNTTSGRDLYVLKTDSMGNIEWAKTYRGEYISEAYSIDTTTDNGYIIAGYIATSSGNAYLLKIDSLGNKVWSKSFGGNLLEEFRDVITLQDGNYVAVGYSRDFGPSDYHMYVVKTNSNGDTLWTTAISNSEVDWCWSVIETFDGYYCVTGVTYDSIQEYNIPVIKIEKKGNGICNNYPTATIITEYNEVISSGGSEYAYTCSVNHAQPLIDSELVIDSNLCMIVSIPGTEQDDQITVFPNPTNGDVFLASPEKNINGITIFNIYGDVIKEYGSEYFFSVEDLANGLYIIKVEDQYHHVYITKLIKNN